MFGERLRAARMHLGYTQRHMADYLGLSLNAYQKYEQGERYPSYELLVTISDYLEVYADWLLGRDVWLSYHGVHVDSRLSDLLAHPKS